MEVHQGLWAQALLRYFGLTKGLISEAHVLTQPGGASPKPACLCVQPSVDRPVQEQLWGWGPFYNQKGCPWALGAAPVQERSAAVSPGPLHRGKRPSPRGSGLELILSEAAVCGWGSPTRWGPCAFWRCTDNLPACLRRLLPPASEPLCSLKSDLISAGKCVDFLKFKSLKAAVFSHPVLRWALRYNSASSGSISSHVSPSLPLPKILFHCNKSASSDTAAVYFYLSG